MSLITAGLLLVFAAAPCYAALSGLTIIPTADVLPPGHVCVDYLVYSPSPLGSGVQAAYLNTQCGIGNRAEVGIDFDFSEDPATGAILNGKVVLRPMDTGLGLAAGVANAGENLRPISYVVATKPWSDRFRLHLGAQRTPDEDNQGFLAADYAVTERIWIYGEYLSGEENASAVTLYYQLTEEWGISLALQRPHDDESENSIVLDIGCVRPPFE